MIYQKCFQLVSFLLNSDWKYSYDGPDGTGSPFIFRSATISTFVGPFKANSNASGLVPLTSDYPSDKSWFPWELVLLSLPFN